MDKTIIKRIFYIVAMFIAINALLISQLGANAVNKVSEMLTDMGTAAVETYNQFSGVLKDKSQLVKENKLLQGDNDALKEQNRVLSSTSETVKAELEDQNEESSAIQKLQAKATGYQTVSGEIIRRNVSDWYDQATINLGTNDGVENGDAVTYKGMLFGYVEDAKDSYSTIRLITNENVVVNIPSMVISSKKEYNGKLNNFDKTTNTFEFESFTPEVELKLYDKVYTNGYTDGIPSGIQIGTIVDIDNDNESKKTIYKVSPSEDLYNARYVSVLVGIND